jgi:2-succinyl-6-hydroxy-2,4-cyclohexadiene-1-carboxylate synthase
LIQPQTLGPHWAIRLARKRTLHPDYLARALLEFSPGGMDPLWDLLPEWNHATELIAGESDAKFIALHTRMAQFMPQATCHTFPDTGHSPHLEAPEAFASWLQDLLF